MHELTVKPTIKVSEMDSRRQPIAEEIAGPEPVTIEAQASSATPEVIDEPEDRDEDDD